jgi:hypothetical protein
MHCEKLPVKNCDCVNCRLARVEEKVDKITNLLEGTKDAFH